MQKQIAPWHLIDRIVNWYIDQDVFFPKYVSFY